MENTNRDKRRKAKKRVEELKGFYTHFIVYIMVNIMISLVITVSRMYNGDSFLEAFFDFGTVSTWFFWGIGVFFHALKVFSFNPIFNKAWEERQIQKYIEEDKQQAEKYK